MYSKSGQNFYIWTGFIISCPCQCGYVCLSAGLNKNHSKDVMKRWKGVLEGLVEWADHPTLCCLMVNAYPVNCTDVILAVLEEKQLINQ